MESLVYLSVIFLFLDRSTLRRSLVGFLSGMKGLVFLLVCTPIFVRHGPKLPVASKQRCLHGLIYLSIYLSIYLVTICRPSSLPNHAASGQLLNLQLCVFFCVLTAGNSRWSRERDKQSQCSLVLITFLTNHSHEDDLHCVLEGRT